MELNSNDVEIWLSGKNNFRYKVYPEYKANRITAKRPKWEQEVKEYLVTCWNAKYSEGCEADDMLGVRAYECMAQGAKPVVVSIDKDLDQLACDHYNFVKDIKYFVTPAQATRFFYYQCLVGDTADGIKGVPGIGPKKANKLLDLCDEEAAHSGARPEQLYYNAVREQFSCYEEFEMTAKCLWIWQKPGDIWKDKFIEQLVGGSP